MRQSTIVASSRLSAAAFEQAEQDALYPFSIQPSGDDSLPWRVVNLSLNAWGNKYETYNAALAAVRLVKQAAEAL
ncbi:hypothetical protein RSB1_gp11 [Ralstonia phage RSB1]|uniref:Uncharacterized protein n=1 Tax=Ralstonia phage RSB1 TaxID=551790 RepID=B5BTU7_9CAUD|nr:hypothetical protein RSB1_gp11 [Ralstonia phage RSB1]BAG70369.1 hypothetical protein [Ralstonia phage RSB1]